MTWLRVTGGALKAKEIVSSSSCAAASTAPSPVQGDDGTVWSEKVDQVRVYNGAKFETVTEVPAGSVCAVTGLTRTFPGEGLGAEPDAESPSLQPVLTYTVLPAGAESDTAGTSGAAKRGGAGHNSVNQDDAEHDAAKSGTGRNEENDTARQTAADNSSPARPQFDDLTLHKVITALRELEDEDPLLHVVWVERLAEIHVQLMGAVQLEIIQQTLHAPSCTVRPSLRQSKAQVISSRSVIMPKHISCWNQGSRAAESLWPRPCPKTIWTAIGNG